MLGLNRLTLAVLTVAGIAAAVAVAQPAKDKPQEQAPKSGQPQTGQPPADDMAAMMEVYMQAATPGKMHERLMKGAGTWEGKITMWHAPGMPPEESTCTTVMTPMFEGRYIKGETTGDMAEMGEFKGFGLYGFDNVSEKFQSVWVDNMGTGIMFGTGELAPDGKSLTWTMKYNDPVTKKETVMREVERHTGDDTMVLEMYGPGPDGKEFKMMEIHYTRTAKHSGDHGAKHQH